MTTESQFEEFVSSAAEAFGRDPGDGSLAGVGFDELLGESFDDAYVRSAVFATFVAHGRHLGRSSALFRLLARPYVDAYGLDGSRTVAGLALRHTSVTAQVAVPAHIGESDLVVDLGGSAGVVVVAPTDVKPVAATSLDPGLVRVAEIRVDGSPLKSAPGEAAAARVVANWAGCLAVAMELLGAGQSVLALGVEHARSREQFGRPIAAFQAVRHLLAQASLNVQSIAHLCRATLRTMGSIEAMPSGIAKAVAGRNARRAADRVCQVLGAPGFTWEHPFHALQRRILVLDSLVIGSGSVLADLARTVEGAGDPANLPSLPSQAEAALASSPRPGMIAAYPGIEISLEGEVATVTLCRPEALNAPDRDMHSALGRLWSEMADRDGVAAVVLTGAGRAFSAGSDRALLRAILDDEAVRVEVIGEASSMLLGLLDLPMPTVAAVNGPAVGLGCSLATMCDLVVMAEGSYLLDPHVPIGLAGGDGVALVWPQLTGLLVAKEYALLGRRLDAGRARELGLAHRVVPSEDLLDTAAGLARRLAEAPAQAVRETKRVLNSGMRRHLEQALPVALSAELRSLQVDENRSALERAIERVLV